ncbi:hypothetical protein PVIIG_06305 [Plasmodium vivax India VII]|uniref:Uncharacterized protein n=1 Tax=Plasmodium vivax India VII TaxID=1077284 RepID=A0A0J9UTA1_PLAVI|nr:hypothetical protein PVIIG_06305 [Plasmodium vivax India VII]
MALFINCNLWKNGIFPKSLEKKYEHDKMLNTIFNRLLAIHELETQPKRISLYGNSLEYKNNQKIKNKKEYSSIYGRMQENNLNNLKIIKELILIKMQKRRVYLNWTVIVNKSYIINLTK